MPTLSFTDASVARVCARGLALSRRSLFQDFADELPYARPAAFVRVQADVEQVVVDLEFLHRCAAARSRQPGALQQDAPPFARHGDRTPRLRAADRMLFDFDEVRRQAVHRARDLLADETHVIA